MFSTDITGARGLPHHVAENALHRKNRGPVLPQERTRTRRSRILCQRTQPRCQSGTRDPRYAGKSSRVRTQRGGGRFMIHARHAQPSWIVIVEPDAGVNLLKATLVGLWMLPYLRTAQTDAPPARSLEIASRLPQHPQPKPKASQPTQSTRSRNLGSFTASRPCLVRSWVVPYERSTSETLMGGISDDAYPARSKTTRASLMASTSPSTCRGPRRISSNLRRSGGLRN